MGEPRTPPEQAAQQPLSRGPRLRRSHVAHRIGRVLAALPDEVYLQLDAHALEQACAAAAAEVYERALAPMADGTYLIHEYGDLILVMATSGAVRAYEVDADGSLIEQDPPVATGLREARECGRAEAGAP